jgi:hypothetical protein
MIFYSYLVILDFAVVCELHRFKPVQKHFAGVQKDEQTVLDGDAWDH